MSGDSGSSFENTARVVRARLDPESKVILARLTDSTTVSKGGTVTYPDLSMRELAELTGYSVSTVQRRLKLLARAKLVRRFVRPGKSYVWQPLVSQLPLALSDAAQQPPLLDVGAVGAVQLEAHPASQWATRGTQGRFTPVTSMTEISATIGQPDRSPVENLTDRSVSVTDRTRDIEGVRSVSVTDVIGQRDRCDRSARPIVPARIKEVRTDKTRQESAAPIGAGLPLAGIAMTAEQRHAAAREPTADGNYTNLLALALYLGRDPVEARKVLAVPIAEEADLREATKTAAAQSAMRYDLHGPTGEGIVRAACFVAWKILCREGRFAFTTLEWHDEHTRRHRGDRRRR